MAVTNETQKKKPKKILSVTFVLFHEPENPSLFLIPPPFIQAYLQVLGPTIKSLRIGITENKQYGDHSTLLPSRSPSCPGFPCDGDEESWIFKSNKQITMEHNFIKHS